MSSSPFELFRRNLKPLMVLLTLLALFSFVVLPSVAMYQQRAMNVGGTDTQLASFDGGEYDINKVGYFTRTHYQTVQFLRQLAETTIARGGSPRVANFQYDEQQQSIRSLGINAEPSDQASVRTMMFADEAKKIGLDLDDTAIRGWLTAFTDGRLTDPEINGVLQTTSRNQLGQFHLYEQLRTQLLCEAFQRKVLAGLAVEGRPIVTPAQQWDLFLRLNRRAVADAYAVNVSDFLAKTAEKPSEQEIKRVFEEAKKRFPDDRSPEPAFRRPYAANLEYLAASLDEFVAREVAGFSEEELRAEYQSRLEGGDFKMPVVEPPATESAPAAVEPAPPSPAAPAATDEPMSEPPATQPPAENPPAEPASGDQTDTPAEDTPAKDAPAKDAPAEDAPAEDAPAEDAPAEDAPTKDAPPKDAPAEDAPAEDAPTENAPAEDAPELNSPAATDSGSLFVPDNDTVALVAFRAQEATDEPEASDEAAATEEPAETPATDPPAAAEPAAETPAAEPPAVESTETPAEAPAETPAEQPAAEMPAETPAEAAAESEPETAEEPANRPFEEVRDEIARSLATGPATEKLEAALNEVEKVMRTYFNARAIAGPDAKQLPERPNLQRLAEELGLTYVETGLIDALDLQEMPIASSFGLGAGMQRGNSFLQTMFIEQPPLFSPLRTFDDQASVSFVSWRTDERQASIPTLEEARPEVIIAIRMAEARKLARAEAEKLAKEFNSADKPIEELIPENRAGQLFQSLGPFSWMNSFGFGMQAFMGDIPELDRVDEAFMRRVFTSPRDTWGTAPNAPETVYYVVRPVEFSPSTEELHKRFSELIQRFQASSLAVEEVIRVRDGYYEALDERTGFEWNENIPE